MDDLKNQLREWIAEDLFYKKIFRGLSEKRRVASLLAKADGWVAGIPFAQKVAEALGLESAWKKASGATVKKGEEVARFYGTPEQIVKLENLVIGLISKPSGIASAAHQAKKAAGGRVRLVSGGWKKHPFPIREIVLEAVASAGLAHRIIDQPFIYLDKNYVRILDGIAQALKAVANHPAAKVIQLRGEFAPIAEEAEEAIRNGAKVIMVDTGSWQDLDMVLGVLQELDPSLRVKLAFAGGIKIEDIPALVEKRVDILDIGAAILDAPWLELSYDVVSEET